MAFNTLCGPTCSHVAQAHAEKFPFFILSAFLLIYCGWGFRVFGCFVGFWAFVNLIPVAEQCSSTARIGPYHCSVTGIKFTNAGFWGKGVKLIGFGPVVLSFWIFLWSGLFI